MGKKKKNCKVRDNCNYTVEYSGLRIAYVT